MKLLLDMNLSPRWVDALREAGFETEHWSTVGPATARDAEIMAYALQNRRVVLTHDLDFSSILAVTGDEKPSVVQIRSEDISPDTIGRQVITSLKQMASELEAGAVLTIDCTRTRLRLLPLQIAQNSDK